MFTGIIEDLGTVVQSAGGASGGRVLTIKSAFPAESLKLGDSIAVNGVCLTATALDGGQFTVDAGPETLKRTTVGRLVVGSKVNLERALAVGDRLGGHIVQGHVDGVGVIEAIEAQENARNFFISLPKPLLPFVASQGSIAVDGISLTVTGIRDDRFSVMIIPHTWEKTTLGERQPKDPVNIEIDVLARYVARMLEVSGGESGGLTRERLKELGYG